MIPLIFIFLIMCGTHVCSMHVPYAYDNTTYGNGGTNITSDPIEQMLDWILQDLDKIVIELSQLIIIHTDEDKQLHLIVQELNKTK